ncbi:MAG TPA: polyphenol oxidase family protein, partial [Patescibacteria group bacterium]
DCVPLLLYHEPSGTIGVIHAGRKGTELGITEKTLKQLPSTEGPLHVWLGPHICEQCYQINRETNEHYNLLRQNLNQMYNVFEKSNLRLNFASDCTAHNNDKFYSYRKEGAGVPMNYGVVTFSN